MIPRFTLLFLTTLCLSLMTGTVSAQQPNFSASVYADGEAWGTKGTTDLPAPRPRNLQSFDKLIHFVNGAPGQLPVAEAAPGNPLYNGGRWFVHTAMWTAEGLSANDPLPVLTSYDQILAYVNLGHLAIAPGSPPGGPSPFFQCPLLPVK